jgi:trehalose 6-phosphate phosphatase
MHDLAPPPPDLLADASLFLDFDGTLVEIAETPDAVTVDPALAALLGTLAQALDGRLAIVSGRPVAEVRALLAPAAPAVAGSHGLEMARSGGPVVAPARAAALDVALAAGRTLADAHPGLLVEDKPYGVGLHYRRAPAAAAAAAALADRLAQQHGLVVQHGKMVVELRLPGHDKGSAVRAIMAEPGHGHTRPVFMGDDITDEAGFAAAAALGGVGILVGPYRESAARYRLDGVTDALAWLHTVAGR